MTKYFILYNDNGILHKYLRDHDISAESACVCSHLDTLKFIGVEEALIEANIRLIMPDFANNRQAKDIVAKVLEIMVKNAIHTNNLTAYAIVNKLI